MTWASRSSTPSVFDLVELGQLRCSLRVDEIDAFEVKDERMQWRLTFPDDRADAIVQRLSGGEEEAAVEAQRGLSW